MRDQERLDRIDEREAQRVNLIAGLEEDGSESVPEDDDQDDDDE